MIVPRNLQRQGGNSLRIRKLQIFYPICLTHRTLLEKLQCYWISQFHRQDRLLLFTSATYCPIVFQLAQSEKKVLLVLSYASTEMTVPITVELYFLPIRHIYMSSKFVTNYSAHMLLFMGFYCSPNSQYQVF